ncbi:MFS transporter [Angustibacter aerolatus]
MSEPDPVPSDQDAPTDGVDVERARGGAGWRARFGPLGEPTYRRYWSGQAVSHLGDRMTPVALAFAVLHLGGSATDLGLVVAAGTLPLAVLLLVGGVWADRLERRRVMLGCDLARAVVQALLAALLLSGTARLWHVAVLAAAAGAAQAFFEPAAAGMLPQVVSRERLGQGSALVGLSQNASMIVGPLLAGVLVAIANPGVAIAVDAATFVVSALFLLRLRVARHVAAPRVGFVQELAAGWREVTSRRWLLAVLGGFTIYHAISLPALLVLGPVVSQRAYGGPGMWAVTTSAFGVGAVLGAVVALRSRPRRPMVWCALLLVGGSVQPVVAGTGLPVWAVAVLIAVCGACVSVLFVVWETTLAQQVPAASLSRVSSFDYFASSVGMPAGFAVVGLVADHVGTRPTMLVAAAVGAAYAVALACAPSVRGLRPAQTDTGSPQPGQVPLPHLPTDPAGAPLDLA